MGDVPEEAVSFLYKTMMERDPQKRRVKPVQHHLLQIDFAGLGDSSDDSDFQIDDVQESDNSDLDDGLDDVKSSDVTGTESSEDDIPDEAEDKEEDKGSDVTKLSASESNSLPPGGSVESSSKISDSVGLSETGVSSINSSNNVTKILICCVCLGEYSEEENEIVECDSCGVAVHEGCYGITESQSVASTISSASTEPWFCDACKAGVKPHCELCPNSGGIYKETDNSRWVHLVCALYVPGVAFGDVDKLSPVTLFEMSYSKWGARECSLCEDDNFSSTGVCICCDAGMCRTYFHVTCAQREGLLSEASPDEEIADPFYAYCKQHADKARARIKHRNYLVIQSSMKKEKDWSALDEKERTRVQQKLNRHRHKYQLAKAKRPPCWQPTEKMPRMLFSSPSATKKLMKKAQLLGIHTQTQITSLQDIRKKWHLPPAFSTEFVSYYYDRQERMIEMKKHNKELLSERENLQQEGSVLRVKYDELLANYEELKETGATLLKQVESIYSELSDFTDKPFEVPESLYPKKSPKRLAKKEEPKSPPVSTIIHQCGVCQKTNNQHLLARCDTCKLYYHLGCLNPPLTRMPKKTRLMGWQCSECVGSASNDSDEPSVDPDAPRRLREKIKEPMKFTPSVSRITERRRSEVTRALAKKGSVDKIKPSPPTQPRSQSTTQSRSQSKATSKVQGTPQPAGHSKSRASPQSKSSAVQNKTSSKPQSTPQSKPQSTPQSKPQSTPQSKPQSTPQSKLQSTPQSKPKSTPQSKHQSTPQSKHQSTPQSKPQGTPQSKPQSTPQSKHQSVPQGKHQSTPQSKSQSAAQSKPQSTPQSKHQSTPQSKHQSAPQSKPQSTPQSKHQSTPQSKHQSAPQSKPQSAPQSKAQTTPPNKQQSTLVRSTQNQGEETVRVVGKLTEVSLGTTDTAANSSKSTRSTRHIRKAVECSVCTKAGDSTNSVKCDGCELMYHFQCLDPPQTKTPRYRGYAWFCAACLSDDNGDNDQNVDKLPTSQPSADTPPATTVAAEEKSAKRKDVKSKEKQLKTPEKSTVLHELLTSDKLPKQSPSKINKDVKVEEQSYDVIVLDDDDDDVVDVAAKASGSKAKDEKVSPDPKTDSKSAANQVTGKGSAVGQSSDVKATTSPRIGLPSRLKRPVILNRSPKSKTSPVSECSQSKRMRLDLTE